MKIIWMKKYDDEIYLAIVKFGLVAPKKMLIRWSPSSYMWIKAMYPHGSLCTSDRNISALNKLRCMMKRDGYKMVEPGG